MRSKNPYVFQTEKFVFVIMNQKQETTTPMPLPPEIYYTKYTNKAIRNGAAPKPPKIPEGAVSVFGQPQVISW